MSRRRTGRMHHIGFGGAHKHTAVILSIDDLNIRVIATNTGELLRALTLDPTRGYQPRFKTNETPESQVRGIRCLDTSHSVGGASLTPSTRAPWSVELVAA